MTGKPLSSSAPSRSMLVAINGGFELQNEDDYTAKGGIRFANDQKPSSVGSGRTGGFVPRPPTEEKKTTDSSKPPRPHPTSTRPKSSDATKRTDHSNNSTTKSWAGNSSGPTNSNQRAKRYKKNPRISIDKSSNLFVFSAGLAGSLTPYMQK